MSRTCVAQVLLVLQVWWSSCHHEQPLVAAQDSWETTVRKPGYCAIGDVCGINDKGNIPCSTNTPALPLDDEMKEVLSLFCPNLWPQIEQEGQTCCGIEDVLMLQGSVSLAEGLLGGCPACYSNFLNLWCTISCSPNQSTFMNVTKVTDMGGVLEADFFFSEEYKRDLFNSCKDVKYGVLNLKAMDLFEGPKSGDEWLKYLGSKDKHSPYQINFVDSIPDEITPLNSSIPGCGSPGFECSCADCASAPYCQQISPPTPSEGNPQKWLPFALLAAFFVVAACLGAGVYQVSKTGSMWEPDAPDGYEPLAEGETSHQTSEHHTSTPMLTYSRFDRALRSCFRVQGEFVSRYPILVLTVAIGVVLVCALGLRWLRIETDPQGLWTPKGSRSVKEQSDYINSFGRFFRIETMILSTNIDPNTNTRPSIVTKENIDFLFDVQNIVDTMSAPVGNTTQVVKLSDICFKPMGDVCAIESVLQYWQMDKENWEKRVADSGVANATEYCFEHWTSAGPSDLNCRSSFLAPIEPKIVLGGFPPETETGRDYVTDTTAFVVTFPVVSAQDNLDAALAWETAFVQIAQSKLQPMAKKLNLTLSFLTERSVQDELERESNADALTIAISYLVMLLYVSVALSWRSKKYSSWWHLFVHSRFSLAVGGVLVVAASVLGALGLCSWMGVKSTLIIMEVIPFLILAVGVDNIFILIHALENQDDNLPLQDRMGTAVSAVGPSISLAATAEALTFAIGIAIPVPAVRSFSICACLAIILDYLLQVTAFVALLVLDTKRIDGNRMECCCCVPVAASEESVETDTKATSSSESLLQKYISSVHIPFLLTRSKLGEIFRCVVLFGTIGLAFLSAWGTSRLSKGLEQQVALPKDSYLQDFFTDGIEYLRVGPPVMFVVRDMNLSIASSDVDNVCAISGCSPTSLVSQISQAKMAGAYHIASPASSWIDDFLMWLKLPNCCLYDPSDGSYCPYSDDAIQVCDACSLLLKGSRPTIEQAQYFLPLFMDSTPSETCARGGKGAYDSAIQLTDAALVAGLDDGLVEAATFRAYNLPLLDQSDFIGALTDTRAFVDSVSKELGLDIYGYSTFHVFFESYVNIGIQAAGLIGAAVLGGLIVCWIYLGTWRAPLLVMPCVLLTMVDIMGVMSIWSIQLNGVSVVNLTMSVGIAMEFCVHIAYAFMTKRGSRVTRVKGALEGVGSSVICGITLTKFVGVIVLGFSQTQIFEIYFFRMYLSLVLLGAWHGLVFLPVLLAYFGPSIPNVSDPIGHSS